MSSLIKAWKLFEVTPNKEPRSLVHGHQEGIQRTRIYSIDTWISCDPNTPGFNVFSSYQDMVNYLPRFKKRKNWLAGCQIHVSNLTQKVNSNYYYLCESIFIPKTNWDIRKVGIDMYDPYKGLASIVKEIEKQIEAMQYGLLSTGISEIQEI